MWLRRAFYWWLIPAAFLLPLWLFVGWIVTSASTWALLWVLFIALPSVLFGQLVLALLVRARGTVRSTRAVSWGDVLGFTVWHGLTIALGFFSISAWAPLLVATIVAGLALFWFVLWELTGQLRPRRVVRHASDGTGYIPPAAPRTAAVDPDIIIVREKPASHA